MQYPQSLSSKPKILVVDDDAAIRLLMSEILTDEGYDIEEVDNGSAALEAIREAPPDMVLLDVKMPGMSGFEVCSQIRERTGDSDISVVMVTGLDDSESIEKAFQLGATAFVTKPINWDTFPYRIQYLLKARNAIVALKQRELHLQTTERISRILTQGKNKDATLREVLSEMLDIFSADRAFIINSQDRSYARLDIVSEAKRPGFSAISDTSTSLAESIGYDLLQGSEKSENPVVSSYQDRTCPEGDVNTHGPYHQMLKSLQVHNTQPWFLALHRSAESKPWLPAEQETFYIISLRLSGVLSRYLLMEQLHQSENLLREAQHVGHIGNWNWNAKSRELSWSDELYSIYGYKPKSFKPTFENFSIALVAEDQEKLTHFKEAVFRSESPHSIEHRILLPNNEIRWVYQQAVGRLDEAGNPVEVNGIIQDITDRIKKQEKEAQNNKMEALGQLTSGVAHDFGNLMTIARGNLELLDEKFISHYNISDDDQEILGDARSAIEDSVELTKQLLAFSRKKSLSQDYLNVEESIKRFAKLFSNILGDRIQLAVNIQKDLPDILVDFTQFESSLLNIVINARNAMPEGGLIRIHAEMAKYSPSQADQTADTDIVDQAVSISVADDGVGMTDEVRIHATEPFFTTRQNEGTGLGLSMAYGFMRQSRGALNIESSPGQGTCVRMLFPVYGGKSTETAAPTRKVPQINDATILVVEDRAEVRQFAVRCLNNLKLKILQADDAESAIGILDNNGDIDLLFTDILMPGDMNGRDLAGWAAKRYPDMKILLTSAAEKEAGQRDGNTGPAFELLPKPYTKQDLIERIHKIL